jgi:hypothetical protein
MLLDELKKIKINGQDVTEPKDAFGVIPIVIPGIKVNQRRKRTAMIFRPSDDRF